MKKLARERVVPTLSASVGCTEQAALGGVTVRSPPHINTMPAWSLKPLTLVLAVVDEGPYRAVSHSAQYFASKKTNLSVAGTNRGRGAFAFRPPRGVKCTGTI
jgi:hypothetical protein